MTKKGILMYETHFFMVARIVELGVGTVNRSNSRKQRTLSQAPFQCLVNALSLTTPAVSRVLLFPLSLNSSTLLRQRTSCVSFCRFCSSCHPNLPSPFPFINSVLPTKHLFDHHRP